MQMNFMENNVDPIKQLNIAKVALMSEKNTVFLTTILFSLKQKFVGPELWASRGKEPTAATDGFNLFIYGPWFKALAPKERVGLLAHEIMHVAWHHMARGKGLDRNRYGIAADHIINITLTDAGMTIPTGGYCEYKYRGMSTKQIYDLLDEDDTHDGNGCGEDIIFDDSDMTPQEVRAKEIEITNTIQKAMIASDIAGNGPGTVPGEIRRMIDDIFNPKLPWELVLQNYMSEYIKEDYSYRKFNRRYFPNFYLPAQYSERLANISAALDLSGSITQKMLTAFLSELKYVWEVMRPMEMDILGWDTKISDTHHIKQGNDILELEFTGGGGTKVSPVLEYFNKTQPTVAIIFSDMEFEHYLVEPTYDILWVCIDNKDETPRHGRMIHYTT